LERDSEGDGVKKHTICFATSIVLLPLGVLVFRYFREGLNRISPHADLGILHHMYSLIPLLASISFFIIGVFFYVRKDME